MCMASGACPSSQPARKKRSWVGSGICSEMGPGWVACGVLGGGSRAWECVNSARDLESCKYLCSLPLSLYVVPQTDASCLSLCKGGGCMFPLTAYSPVGKDCSTLPGVADVACLSGECVVHRCLPGYVPALDRTSCIRRHPVSQSQFDDAEDVPAKIYGPEHVLLGGN
jgi:hypothetical protein